MGRGSSPRTTSRQVQRPGYAGRRVLACLGVNVDARPGDYRPGYLALMPNAVDGYWRWLGDRSREAARGLDRDAELRELAGELRIPKDLSRLPRLQAALAAANARTGGAVPDLNSNIKARIHLVHRLADSPSYSRLLEDVLVETIEASGS